MYSKSKKSTAKGLNRTVRHKKYHDRVCSIGCMITGDKHHVTLHHIYGAKTELKNSVGESIHIGEDAVIPLHPLVHLYQYADIAIRNGEYNLEGHKKEFIDKNGTELDLFVKMIDRYQQKYPDCEYIDMKKIQLIVDRGLNKVF
jgi:hypothetical protein